MNKELFGNITIGVEKLTQYLLVQKSRNDKSKFLEQAGYTLTNWEILETDLRSLFMNGIIIFEEETEYGKIYSVSSKLIGPNGKELEIKTIWMRDEKKAQTKFVTLYPEK